MARTPTLFDPDVSKGVFSRFFGGLRASVAGVPIVFTDGRLLALSIVPMLVHVTLFAGLLYVLVGSVAPDAARWLAHTLGTDDVDATGLAKAFNGIVFASIAVLGIITSFFGSIFVASVVCDPFYDALSERTEQLFLGRAIGTPFTVRSVVTGIFRELEANVVRLFVWGIVAVPLWLASFTFLGIVTGPLSVLWAWFFSAYEFFSRSLVRHTVHYLDRFRTFFSHKAFFLGFGAGAAVLSLLPFTSPFLIAGATRAYLAMAARGRVASRLDDDDKARLIAIIEKKAIAP